MNDLCNDIASAPVVMVYVFAVGVAITGDTLELASALTDYSYIFNATDSPGFYGALLARCVTGLGPTDSSFNVNGVLGGWSFNGTTIPKSDETRSCSPNVIQVIPGGRTAGVINMRQCEAFNTSVEGIYTCTMMNSAMVNQSLRLGIYFTGRSKSLDIISLSTIVHNSRD